MKKLVVVFALAGATAGVAAADGIEPSTRATAPAPLRTHNAPAQPRYAQPDVHYGAVGPGQAVRSNSCGGDTYDCNGSFVTTGPVLSTFALPDHVETVPPVIHRPGTYQQQSRLAAPPSSSAAPASAPRRETVRFDAGSLDGGVGANVNGWTGGGGGYSAIYPMYRSRSSVLSHPASQFALTTRRTFARRCVR